MRATSPGSRALYGARIDDVYGQQGRGSGLSDAVDVSAGRVTATEFALGKLSLTASGDSDYFSVVAPTSGASLHVMAIAGGVSMLSAQVSVYDASGNLLDVAGDASTYGLNVTASVAGVVAGQRYYIKVSGATDDVFSIGSYGLEVSFEGGSHPPSRARRRSPPLPTLPAVVPVVPSLTPPAAPPYTPPSTPPYSPPYTPPRTPPSTPPDYAPRPHCRDSRQGQDKTKKIQRRLGQPQMRRRMPRFPGGVKRCRPPLGLVEIFEATGRAVVG